MSFENLKVGDKITRLLAGVIPMELVVTEIKDGVLTCGLWTFDAASGAEIDHDLGWGPLYGVTGSYLVRKQ